ncbi:MULTISPECIES: AraC family transcriptional regulator [unclassified Caballeronia]|jgi:AraC-like DNA-binding protein|uniref:AraC family transcriptional regulator n=1 Tax=unclassified Caballeronia TaxID=2646786 RepID=UPI002028C0AE|nr:MULTISPECIES: AraC family transcriptional regulator [unclassified Caballeronia]MDR5773338.1 AraC family transcriptional regulator [Caballeronia sp. LZ002]MDR5806113.1 AraC family transcriptional regulator [Caballeronia sp. LZ001]MDR5848772.1 AraC family transcriptional regulator [Caballeronia sp. LZ003]
MIDPLAEVVTLLQPAANFSKLVHGASPWHISRSDAGQPFYCVILEGGCRISIDGYEPIELLSGDFMLIPAAYGVAVSSLEAPPPGSETQSPVALGNGEFRIGPPDSPIDARMMAGHCSFGSPDAALLVSLLPRFVHVRGERRLATLVQLVREESREQRPAREVVLSRLLEVLLIEALRSTAGTDASPGLVRGLSDLRLAAALRGMHERSAHAWTVAELAKEAALSRSTFFERFSRAVGVAPMEYLLRWRMALAKDLLRRSQGRIAEIAQRVGYSSASTFSVAFTRHVGRSPSQYARDGQAAED